MPDNSQGQVPEGPARIDTENVQGPAEAPEIPVKSVAPQPAAPSDDKATAQNIQKNLQNDQLQQPPVSSGQGSSVAPVKKAASSEPYIKAAENVIEKDKNDPYKEEEDHEDVQIQYLKDRFGKDIKRSD